MYFAVHIFDSYSMKEPYLKPATHCVHTGTINDEIGRGVNSPIVTSSAFQFLNTEENLYPRYFNTPNQRVVVEKLCALEKGADGLVFASGMSAISTAMVALLKPGDHVVMQDQIYGGTYFYAKTQLQKLGVTFTLVKGTDPEKFRAALQPNSRILYFETPSNPLMSIVDIAKIAQLANEHNLTSIIDNTFASPINQNPLTLGVDVVMHSGTKYLGGHSDLCFGALITSNYLRTAIQEAAVNWGGSLDSMTCFQIERSLKTLWLRVERQNQNAMYLATALQKHSKIKKVYYPGLETHPGHQVAKSQMSGFGGMLAFELKKQGSAVAFCKQLKLIKPALSLGGVETIISIPRLTSHVKMSKQDRLSAGVTDDLLRLSVGIEDPGDLLEDLLGAMGTLEH